MKFIFRTLALIVATLFLPLEIFSYVFAFTVLLILSMIFVVEISRAIYEFVGHIVLGFNIGVPKSLFEASTERSMTQVILIIYLGIALFVIRSKLLFLYGLIEVFVGAIIAWLIAIKFNPTPPFADELTYLSVLSGAYIIVRGLDNVDKSLPSDMQSRRRRFFNRHISRRPPDGENLAKRNIAKELWTYTRRGVWSDQLELQRRKKLDNEKALCHAMKLNDAADKLSTLSNVSLLTISIGKTRKALNLYRELLPFFPKTVTPEIANTLSKLAARLSMNQEHEEALAIAEEAAELYRTLAKPPEGSIFLPNLAIALNELSSKFAALDLQNDSRAVATRQQLTSLIHALSQRDD